LWNAAAGYKMRRAPRCCTQAALAHPSPQVQQFHIGHG
jgi:hypothetical protein